MCSLRAVFPSYVLLYFVVDFFFFRSLFSNVFVYRTVVLFH